MCAMKNILELFEKTSKENKDKVLFADVESSITFGDCQEKLKRASSYIASFGYFNRPIAVLDSRSVNTLLAMFSVVYSGNHYVVLDSASPISRLETILGVVEPVILLCDSKTKELAQNLCKNRDIKIIEIEQAVEKKCDQKLLDSIRSRAIDNDPVYILFTSGSTGVPKGTVINHRNLLSYVKWYKECFEIDNKTIFASQTPFYFSASVSDLYSSFLYGATYNIIPKSYFSFPIKLIEFMNERKVNTIYWVPSALCIVANIKLFDYAKPKYLKKVLFAGEIMPCKQLNYWRKNLEGVTFANLFGPTETTDICTYYKVDREFSDTDSLPIGKSCEGIETFIVGEDQKQIVEPGKIGELYVRGDFVASGYYKNSEQTAKAFVQNPLNKFYPEIVYKTGDLVMLNERKEYIYAGRKDYQIKHKGYRIELGEIERMASGIEKVDTPVALYDSAEDKIILIYLGRAKLEEVEKKIPDLVPNYMVPEVIKKVVEIPYNQNGKIDRKALLANYKNL